MPVINSSLKGAKEVAAEISNHFAKMNKAQKDENGYFNYAQTDNGIWTVKTQSGDFMPELSVKF